MQLWPETVVMVPAAIGALAAAKVHVPPLFQVMAPRAKGIPMAAKAAA